MNRLLIFCLLVLLGACLSEENADVATPNTFTHYFNDGYDNVAVAIEETADKGFIILANSAIRNSEAEQYRFKILLIKIDQFGNEEWRQHYPDLTGEPNGTGKLYTGHSLMILPGGYLITGEEIDTETRLKRQLLLLKVNKKGEPVNSTPKTYPTANLIGQAATRADNNYLVLASSPSDAESIYVGAVDTTTFGFVWVRQYGQGTINLINKIFYTPGATPLLFFGGEQKQAASTYDGFVTPTPLDAASPPGGITQQLGTNLFNDFAGDFCQKGQNFGFVGHTAANGDDGDIVFYKVSSDGKQLDSKTYTKEIFSESDTTAISGKVVNNKKEVGNAIVSTTDGGYIILGTIATYAGVLGNGNTDLLLLKINGNGDKEWSRPYGGLDADNGTSIRQTSDGGYIVLGDAKLGALRTIMIIKTDNLGDVD